jgi:phospholipid/cholesterol/gamma-HCH transport system substrate-binding protein
MDRVIELSDQLRKLFSAQNVQNVSETLDNLRKLSGVAADRSGEIGSAIDNASQAMKALHDTLDSANAVLASLKPLVAPQGSMQETLKSINDASHQIGLLAQHIDQVVVASGPQITELSKHSVTDIDDLTQETQALVQQLSRIADSIERDPTRVIYGDRRQGYKPQ